MVVSRGMGSTLGVRGSRRRGRASAISAARWRAFRSEAARRCASTLVCAVSTTRKLPRFRPGSAAARARRRPRRRGGLGLRLLLALDGLQLVTSSATRAARAAALPLASTTAASTSARRAGAGRRRPPSNRQRQVQRRADAVGARTGAMKQSSPRLDRPTEGDQVDVRIELRRAASTCWWPHRRASVRHQIGAAADQVGRPRQRRRMQRRERRRERVEACSALPGELGQRMARARAASSAPRSRRATAPPALGLAQFDARVQPGGDALAHQRQDLLALRAATRWMRRASATRPDRRGSPPPGWPAARAACASACAARAWPMPRRARRRGRTDRAPARADLRAVVPLDAAGQRRRDQPCSVKCWSLSSTDSCLLRLLHGTRGVPDGDARHAKPLLGGLQAGRTGERLVDDRIQRRIAPGRPPACLGPGRGRAVGAQCGALQQCAACRPAWSRAGGQRQAAASVIRLLRSGSCRLLARPAGLAVGAHALDEAAQLLPSRSEKPCQEIVVHRGQHVRDARGSHCRRREAQVHHAPVGLERALDQALVRGGRSCA